MEKRPAGVVVFTYPIGDAFAQKVKRYSESEINLYTSGHLIGGTLPALQALGGDAGDMGEVLSQVMGNPVRAAQYEVEGKSYSAGILSLGPANAPMASLAALYSNSVASENTMQMIQVLTIIAAVCVLVIVPIAICLVRV